MKVATASASLQEMIHQRSIPFIQPRNSTFIVKDWLYSLNIYIFFLSSTPNFIAGQLKMIIAVKEDNENNLKCLVAVKIVNLRKQ